jgi:hypothetical protein
MPKEDAPAAAIAQRENLAVRDQLRSTDIVPAAKRADVFNPKSYDEALKMAREVAQSDFIPKAYANKPGNVLVAWQMGAELGLKPMQAVQNIAVINGQPGLWGDAVPALIMAQPDFIDMIESWDGGTAKCTMKRKDRADVTREFSDADVAKAQLGGKDTYVKYGKRMKQMRARAWAARDMWADVLKGLGVVEEIMTNEIDVTPERGQETVAGLSERTAARAAQTRTDGKPGQDGKVAPAGSDITDAAFVETKRGEGPPRSDKKEINDLIDQLYKCETIADLNHGDLLNKITALSDVDKELVRSHYSVQLKKIRAAGAPAAQE